MLQPGQTLSVMPADVGYLVGALPIAHPFAPYIRVGSYTLVYKFFKGIRPALFSVYYRVIFHCLSINQVG